ncbi:MAG: hypothetical protein GY858_09570 [Candidatus Omnitrophica bacterium]|nr:hypothetical protein [Candidatus Omnitrophota bacterium]
MKKVALALMFLVIASPLYASDWDKFGKVAAGLEGLRLLSRGRIDVFGAIAGVNGNSRKEKNSSSNYNGYYTDYTNYTYNSRRHHRKCCKKIWVPQYSWRKKYVPRHIEYTHYGKVITGGHYVKYRVETGGYWKTTCKKKKSSLSRRRRYRRH